MPGGSKKGGGLVSSATYKLAAGDNPDVPVRAATKKITGENPDTGTTGGRVGKGMSKTGSPAKSTGYAPFKMKGSPFQRNFGIGSPAKKEEGSMNEAGVEHKHEDHHKEEEAGAKGMMKTGSPAKRMTAENLDTGGAARAGTKKIGSAVKDLGGAKGKGEMKPQKYKPR